jgi:hypothetical protein
MRTIGIYVIAAFLAAILAPGCGENYENRSPFDNAAYIDVAESRTAENVTFKRTVTDLERTFAARLTYPAPTDVEVSFAVDPALVAVYNAGHGTSYTLLPEAHWTLAGKKAVVPAGAAVSQDLAIAFGKLDELEIDATYLVPLTVTGATGGVEILEGSRTVYYLVRRSSAITTAANLRDNWFSVPTFEAVGPGPGDVVKDMPSITYEALVWVNDFNYAGPSGGSKQISTIMGCEQHFLMRIGDSSFPVNQLQVQGPGGKFPETDKSKGLNTGEWYHIALTWDIPAQVITFYVNGQVQSRSASFGGVTSISLKNSGHGFYIGRSFNDNARTLDGNIAEARIWSVARTQQEIWDNMYNVDPASPGLAAYWKFDTPGDIVADVTGNGNDAIADHTVYWPDGIEIPQLNRAQ